MPRFPPSTPPGWSSPTSQVISRHSDFPSFFSPHFVSFAWRYHDLCVMFLFAVPSHTESDRSFDRLPCGVYRGNDRISQVSVSPRLSVCLVPATPVGATFQTITKSCCCSRSHQDENSGDNFISGLNGKAFGLAVYASQ
jgi:hypothetical protein